MLTNNKCRWFTTNHGDTLKGVKSIKMSSQSKSSWTLEQWMVCIFVDWYSLQCMFIWYLFQLYKASMLFEAIRHEMQHSMDYKLSLFDLQTSSYQALQRVLVSLGDRTGLLTCCVVSLWHKLLYITLYVSCSHFCILYIGLC